MGQELEIVPGTQLGRYVIVTRIGAGGMGAVFRARDTVLGREVAIKVLPDGLRHDARARARFEREAKLLAALSHPNVLSIHDFGDVQTVSFAVMELLEGATLRDALRHGPFAPETARLHARAIADGLAAAHARGIVHRDLKPENIFLPSTGPLKILDFGLARYDSASGGQAAETVLVTQPGTVLGTLAYMAPEQAHGLEGDARSDIFAFGAVLFEMLSGSPAFARRSPAETLTALLTQDPAPLPAAAWGFKPVVDCCLQKEPAQRYQSASMLIAALDAVVEPASGSAVVTGPVVLAGPAPLSSIAVLPFSDMSAEKSLEYLCDGIAEEILLALTKVSGLRVVARSSAFRFKGTAEDVRSVGRTLGVAAVLEGSVRAAGDQLRVVTQLVETSDGYHLWTERFDRRLDDAFALQDEIAAAVAATLRVKLQGASGITPPLPTPRDPETYSLYLKARHHWNRRTEVDLLRSVEFFIACIERDPDYVQAQAGLAEAYVTLGIYGARPPHDVMPIAREFAERALAASRQLAGALAADGCVLALYDWNWDEADRRFRAAIDTLPGASGARSWYAMSVLAPRGRFEEAEAELGRALELDPLSASISTSLGICAYVSGRPDLAVQRLNEVIALDKQFPLAHQYLGLSLSALNRHVDAIEAAGRAIELSGSSPEAVASAACIDARAGRKASAEAHLSQLVSLASTRYVSPCLVAQVHAAMGAEADALLWLEVAMSDRSADLAWVGVRPMFEPLAGRPEFDQMLARLGLPARLR
jgi:serine/threonine-protein kinase